MIQCYAVPFMNAIDTWCLVLLFAYCVLLDDLKMISPLADYAVSGHLSLCVAYLEFGRVTSDDGCRNIQVWHHFEYGVGCRLFG